MPDLHYILYLAAAGLLASSLLRAQRARRAALHAAGSHFHVTLPVTLNFFAALFIALGIFLGAALVFQQPVLLATRVLALVILFTAALDTFVALRCQPASARSTPRRKQIASGVALLLAVGALAFVGYLRSAPGSEATALQLVYPVRGTWRAVTGGRSALTNYHHDNPPAQNLAVDLVCTDAPSEGQPIYAPLAGRIITAIGDRPSGGPEPEGNLIIIQAADGTDIWLAHLQQHSVRVKPGEQVAPGQLLAACGATGSAETPHLHIHAERNRQPISLRFGPQKTFLLRNTQFTNAR
jgi:hypothetical protein